MEQTPISKAEEMVAANLINSFVGLVHARLRGHFSKAVMYENELNELGVRISFTGTNGEKPCHG